MNNDGIDKASKENYRSGKRDSAKGPQTMATSSTGVKQKIEWVEVKSKTGKFYYYNKYINKSMWEKPSVYMPYQETSKIVDQSCQNGISNSGNRISKGSPKIKRLDNGLRPIFGKDTSSLNHQSLSHQSDYLNKRNTNNVGKNENGFELNGRRKSVEESITSGIPVKKFRLEDGGAISISETESSSANNTPKRVTSKISMDNSKNGYDYKKNSFSRDNNYPETPKTPRPMPKSKDYFYSPRYSPVHRDYKKKDYIHKRQKSLLRSPIRYPKNNGHSNTNNGSSYSNEYTLNDNYDSDRSLDDNNRYYSIRKELDRCYSRYKFYRRPRSRSFERRRRSYSSEGSYHSPKRYKSTLTSKRNYRENSLTRGRNWKTINVDGQYVNGKYDANKINMNISEIVERVRNGSISKKIRSPTRDFDEYKSRYYKTLRTSKSLSKLDNEEKISDENAKDLQIKRSKSMQKMKALFQAENISDIDSPALEENNKGTISTEPVSKDIEQSKKTEKVLTEGSLNSSDNKNVPKSQIFDKKKKEKVKGLVGEKSKEKTNSDIIKIEDDPIMKEIVMMEEKKLAHFSETFEVRLCNRKTLGKIEVPQYDGRTDALDDALTFLKLNLPNSLNDIQLLRKEIVKKSLLENDNINIINRNIILECKKKDNEFITDLYKAHLEAEVSRHKVTFQEFSSDYNFYRAQVEFGREVGHIHYDGCTCPDDLKNFRIRSDEDEKYYKSIMNTFKLKNYPIEMKEQVRKNVNELHQRLQLLS
ncbi:WW domain-containing protein [Strongyloides ratti]|uniref:WW domain-containing protein n=1 Tax=Strongyloides ratti TaxID=34506 RepID=A0A090MYP7_STRRB|nr:WW domain-containing protein [Strongyloides ratti]CEF67554.1 WW domain-containing protein [Strongyloides ratti]